MSALMDAPSTKNTFMELRKIYELIIHIHKVYEVQLVLGSRPEDNTLFLETLETSFRKYMNSIFEIYKHPTNTVYLVYYRVVRKEESI
jgi:hypothetical protein